ncbi:MAG: hypothetical protein II776_03730 [Clostridia bacterium]|nr:hypothetical protein [Clostridia bacterium]
MPRLLSVKDGASYVCVMLGANMDRSRNYGGKNMAWIETSTLLSYVLENFSLQTLLEKGRRMAELPVVDSEAVLPVVAGEDLSLLVRNGTEPEFRLDLPEAISALEVEDGAVVGRVTLTVGDGEAEKSCPLLLQWDGTPVVTKSELVKEGEKIIRSVQRIFTEDRQFVILVILLLVVVAISVPALKVTQYLLKKKSKPPKH